MNSEDFLYIEAIVAEGGFSRAARRLNISQPALSARLSRLEARLGVQLLDRSLTPPQLTQAGQIYWQRMRRIGQEERLLLAQLAELQQGLGGSLSLGASSCFSSYLPSVLAQFRRLYPQVQLRLRNGRIPELAQLALEGELDLFISPLPVAAAAEDGLLYSSFLRERVFICLPAGWEITAELAGFAVPADDLLQGRSVQGDYPLLPAEKLAGLPRILLEEDQDIRRIADLFCPLSDHEPPPLIADQMLNSYLLSCAGVGWSLITDSFIRCQQQLPPLCFYAFQPQLACRELALARNPAAYYSTAAARLVQMMQQAYQDSMQWGTAAAPEKSI